MRRLCRRWESHKVETVRPGHNRGRRARGGSVARLRLRHGRRGQRRRAGARHRGRPTAVCHQLRHLPHTVGGRNDRDDRPEPRQRLRRRRRTRLRAELDREPRPRPDPARLGSGRDLHDEQEVHSADADAGEHPQGPGRGQRRRLRRLGGGLERLHVECVVRKLRHRRPQDLQGSRLRRLPHARRREGDRHPRPESRPAEAGSLEGRASGDRRRRHHARLQERR